MENHDGQPFLLRYSPPSKYDHAPHGTKCKVMSHNGPYETWTQTSKKEDEPRWEKDSF